MKLYRAFLIALMTSAFAAVGCGDDGGGGSSGNGQSADAVCAECENQGDIPLFVTAYNSCNNPDEGACAAAALLTCEVV